MAETLAMHAIRLLAEVQGHLRRAVGPPSPPRGLPTSTSDATRVPPALDFTTDPEIVRVVVEGERLSYGHLFCLSGKSESAGLRSAGAAVSPTVARANRLFKLTWKPRNRAVWATITPLLVVLESDVARAPNVLSATSMIDTKVSPVGSVPVVGAPCPYTYLCRLRGS